METEDYVRNDVLLFYEKMDFVGLVIGRIHSRNRNSDGLRVLTCLLDHTRFSHVSGPPRERGTTWSRLPSSGRSNAPVYWQRLPSRSRMFFALSFGRFLGTRA